VKSFISDFFVFLWALITTWANLWTGGIIVAAVGVYHIIRERTPTKKTYRQLAILFALLACFNTWRDEYKKTNPGLHLSLEEYGFAEKVTGDGEQGPPLIQTLGTTAIVVATARSLGAPTVADNWALIINIPRRKEAIRPRMLDFNLPNQPPLHIEGDLIPLSKLLYKQTLSPIATGNKKQGFSRLFR
jgi:hypothetical protein